LRRSNVDTDQIIPAVYLSAWREPASEDGCSGMRSNEPDFVLNQSRSTGRPILVAGPHFAPGHHANTRCGRWSTHGFKAVNLPRFRGHLPRQLAQGRSVDGLLDEKGRPAAVDDIEDAEHRGTVDLVERKRAMGPARCTEFSLDDYTRWRLLEGLDDRPSPCDTDDDRGVRGQRKAWFPSTTASAVNFLTQ